jgi:archaellum component FlaC
MEIVYFVLGVVTILLILGTVVIVRVSTSVKELKEEVQQLEKVVGDAFSDIRDLHRRIDDEVHRRIDDTERELQIQIKNSLDFIGDTKDVLHRRIDGQTTGSHITNKEINSRIDDEMRDVYSQLDSRLDKLESKLTDKFSK